MTDQLEGRALDEACAMAMGWVPSERWNQFTAYFPLNHYSTDAACIPEMLASLHAESFGFVEATMWHDGTCTAKAFGSPNHHLDSNTEGTTIQQALARLVCAVAEAKKETNQ